MGGMSKTILPILRVRDSVSLIIQRQHHVKMGIRFPIGLLLKGQPPVALLAIFATNLLWGSIMAPLNV